VVCFIRNVSEKKRRRIPISPAWVRFLFRAGHIVIPVVGTVFIYGHIVWHWILSWELIALVAMILVPFALPLLGFYVGKIGAIEMTDRDIFEDFESRDELVTAINEIPPEPPTGAISAVPPPPPPPPPTSQTPHFTERLPLDPHFNALASEEQKVMRTLWKFQSDYIKQGKSELWGFVVNSGSPDYRPFVRGVSSLMQRGLVKQDPRGLVFLTDHGLGYCDRNSDLIEQEGEAWTQFAPSA